MYDAVRCHKIVSSGELGESVYAQFGEVIVLVGKIAGGPDKTGGGGLRLHFLSQFDSPANALVVYNVEFRRCAIHVFVDKFELAGGLVFFSSGSVEEVESCYVAAIPPKRGACGALYVVRLRGRVGGGRRGDKREREKERSGYAKSVR